MNVYLYTTHIIYYHLTHPPNPCIKCRMKLVWGSNPRPPAQQTGALPTVWRAIFEATSGPPVGSPAVISWKHWFRNTSDVAVKHRWLSCRKIGFPAQRFNDKYYSCTSIRIHWNASHQIIPAHYLHPSTLSGLLCTVYSCMYCTVYMLQVNLFLRSICFNLGQFVPT